MANIIMDHFSITNEGSIQFYEPSDDNELFDFSIHFPLLRKPAEDVYRLMYYYDVLNPEDEWIVDFEQRGNVIYFLIDLMLMLQKLPHFDGFIRSLLNKESLEHGEHLISIAKSD